MSSLRATVLAFVLASTWAFAVSDYVWPNEQSDELENILYEQSNGLASEVANCAGAGNFGSGTSFGAEWLRNAYHDMATADIDAGTGGLDASIVFETSRPENVGNAFAETLGSLGVVQSTRASVADLFAVGAILAVGACSNGTIRIPMRPGRVDASGPGPSGVPQPHEDLASHTASFKRQGFNTQEMIALVACGHSIGGVHGVDFPEIVPFVKNNNTRASQSLPIGHIYAFQRLMTFLLSFSAGQFVANISQNPLAFGDNVTTRSDFRIFNADGGEMIGNMAASSDFFRATCSSLLERMINTVPRGVVLGDVIEPILVKPKELIIEIGTNGSMTVWGELRIADTIVPSSDSQVLIHLLPRSEEPCSATQPCPVVKATKIAFVSRCLYPNCGPNWGFYTFSTVIPISQGISSFTVEISDSTTNTSAMYDNSGHRFPLPDMLQPQIKRSSVISSTSSIILNLTVAVLNAERFTDVTLVVPEPVQNGAPINTYVTVTTPMTPSKPIFGSNYTLYTAVYNTPGFQFHPYDIIATGPGISLANKFNAWSNIFNPPI
ncbi:heme peroxidase [Thozetella sp. PMI_491]|nr:heme peroxidase [Thozetella sp. PMI_491]